MTPTRANRESYSELNKHIISDKNRILVPESRFWGINTSKIPTDIGLRFCPLGGPILRLCIFRPFGIFSWKNIFCRNNAFTKCFDKTPLPQWSYELCDHFMFLSKTRFTIVIYSRKFDFSGTPPSHFYVIIDRFLCAGGTAGGTLEEPGRATSGTASLSYCIRTL